MTDMVQQEGSTQKKPKWILIVAIIAIVLIAGIFTVQALVSTSTKEDYFLAEKSTFEQLQETFESRFQDELAWKEHTKEHAIESTYEITGQTNDLGMGEAGPGQIINNANITVDTALDTSNQKAAANISASMAGIELNGIETYIEENDVYIGLPFLDDIIQFNGDDLGKVLQAADPYYFTGEENLDFSTLFNEGPLPEEDIEYINEEYVQYLYEELPEEAFEGEKEQITVGSNDVNTSKISFNLSEDETKIILKNLLNKMAQDEKLQTILIDQISYMEFVDNTVADDQIDSLKEAFTEALNQAATNMEQVAFPDGFQSTIWINNHIIVQRELDFQVEYQGETIELTIDGTNEQTDENQTMTYNITLNDGYTEETATVQLDLTDNDGETEDIISFSASDVALTIELNQEKQDDGNKNFERSISVTEFGVPVFALYWLGDAHYEKDQMTVDHTFYAEDGFTFNQDTLSIFVTEEGTTTDNIDIPSSDQVTDLGDMTGDEIFDYLETDVADQLDIWLNSFMGPGMF
ncbi:DUF6583 family protein [Gracilibacillus sp. S3-1-1]|uniref:DUF6583 family protein n=1 Tax=Gracilibacillus pellucidus TaxID=3095368 RepID=A0ACC6M2X3_9BACI|nr:DUF6583 family protein [Gracilibacillus sp. S3-1-1]MDX8045233.1 DUF6583 family protein [Gracilibacillus sp. S3-1-1]